MAKPDGVFVYVGTYPDEMSARDDYEIVKDLHAAGAVGTYDASVVTKDENGKVHVNKDETSTRHGAWGGAAVGAVVGILFPPSLIGSAIVGAGVGGVGGHLWKGMSRADVKEFGELIDTGEAALVIVGESTIEAALDKADLKAEKHVAKELDDVSSKDIDQAVQEAAKEAADRVRGDHTPRVVSRAPVAVDQRGRRMDERTDAENSGRRMRSSCRFNSFRASTEMRRSSIYCKHGPESAPRLATSGSTPRRVSSVCAAVRHGVRNQTEFGVTSESMLADPHDIEKDEASAHSAVCTQQEERRRRATRSEQCDRVGGNGRGIRGGGAGDGGRCAEFLHDNDELGGVIEDDVTDRVGERRLLVGADVAELGELDDQGPQGRRVARRRHHPGDDGGEDGDRHADVEHRRARHAFDRRRPQGQDGREQSRHAAAEPLEQHSADAGEPGLDPGRSRRLACSGR